MRLFGRRRDGGAAGRAEETAAPAVQPPAAVPERVRVRAAETVQIDLFGEQPHDLEQPAEVLKGRRLFSLSGDRRSLAGSLGTAGFLQLVLIASGVVVARSLGAEDRGFLALLIVISGICTLVGSLGIFSSATYYIARDPDRSRRIVRSLRGTALVQTAATSAVQVVVLIAVVGNDPKRVQVAALISLLLTPGLFAYGYGEAILLGRQRFTAFNILRAIPTTMYAVLVLVVYVLGIADIVIVMAIWAGANVVGGILALAIALRELPTAATTEPIPSRRTMTGFGLRSLLGSLSPVESFRADQAVVGLFLNPVALGLYVVAQALTNLPRTIATSIGYVAYPRVSASSDPRDARRRMWKYFVLGAVVIGVAVAALELIAAPLISLFFGSEFRDAVPIAEILLVGTYFSALRKVLTEAMRGLGHPGLGTIAEISSWIMLVPAVALLLPHGATGVALALTLAWAGSLIVALLFAAVAGKPTFGDGLSLRAHTFFGTGLRSRPSLALVFASLAAVVGVGAAASRLSPRAALMIVIALVGGLFFAFCRSAVRRKSEAAAAEDVAPSPIDATPEADVPHPPDLRLARAIYYLGLVLIALLTVRVSYQVTFSDVFFLLSIMIAAAELVIVRRNVPIRIPLLLLGGMAIFTVGGLLSSIESYSALKSTAVVVRLIFLTVFWFWLGTLVLRRQSQVRTAIILWVLSAAICGAGAILQFVAGDVIPNADPVWGRTTGFTNHPNDLGGVTAIAFVPALMLAARAGVSLLARLSGYLLLLMVTAGLVLSGSVGAMLAAFAGIFVWFALQRRSRRSLTVLAVMLAGAVAITTFQSVRGAETPLDRFRNVTAESSGPAGSGSLESRIATYRVAAKAIKDNPFVGVGLDLVSVTKPFGIVSYEYDVHNLIIGTWYKAGLLGMIGMLVALFAVIRLGWAANLAAQNDSEQMMVAALLGAVAAFVVFAMGAPVLFSRYGWIAAALLLALRAVQVGGREPQRPPHEEATRAKTGSYDVGPGAARAPTGLNPA